jgi:hypothetical protein
MPVFIVSLAGPTILKKSRISRVGTSQLLLFGRPFLYG